MFTFTYQFFCFLVYSICLIYNLWILFRVVFLGKSEEEVMLVLEFI